MLYGAPSEGNLNERRAQMRDFTEEKREMTDAESIARALYAGDATVSKQFVSDVALNDRRAVLPVLWALRLIFAREGHSTHVGDLACTCIVTNPKLDDSIRGGLITLVTSNRPSQLPQVLRLTVTNPDATPLSVTASLLETMLTMRSVVNDIKEKDQN